MKESKPKIDRWLYILSISFIMLFIALIISKLCLPSGGGGWSNIPVVDFLFIFSLSVCVIGIAFRYSCHAWTKNADEFSEWYISQVWRGSNWARSWDRLPFLKEYRLWSTRLISPLVVVMLIIVLLIVTFKMITGQILS